MNDDDYNDIINKYNEINKNSNDIEPIFSTLYGKVSTTPPGESTSTTIAITTPG